MSDYSQPSFSKTAKATNGIATVTITAPTGPFTIYITGWIISASAAPAAAVEATLTGATNADGTTGDTINIEIPASAFAMMSREFGSHPLKIKPATNAVLTLPALGAAVVGSATLFYRIK
jgi:hypothetical protein